MTPAQSLALGRDAVRRRAWGEAFRALSAADQEAALDAADLEALAEVAYLLGQTTECHDILARAHQAFLAESDAAGGARSAFRLGLDLLMGGDRAQGTGWLARARRVLDDARLDCAERGYLLIPEGIMAVQMGDVDTALARFTAAVEIAVRFKDKDLLTWALMGQGRALIRTGERARGVSLLDEAMVAVTAGEVSPSLVSHIYCSVIDGCYELFDLRRAHEWTAALSTWCESQPELQPHRGDCLVRRAEVMQLHGEWQDALEAAEQAGIQLSQPRVAPSAGGAFYRQAELHRLRGEFEPARAAYRKASEAGRQVEPGHALLRLAMGDTAQAMASIRRAADEARDRSRPPILVALVEIALATGDVNTARAAARELVEIAATYSSPWLVAHAAQATGAVALADGLAREALAVLRGADEAWRDLGAPYESAQVRLLIARACRAQGDGDAADLEIAAARKAFERLGARPDIERLEKIETGRRADGQTGKMTDELSPREREVLIQIAAGRSNKAIGTALTISEKTVARHVANIFTKIGVANRAAATSWAYQKGLVRPST